MKLSSPEVIVPWFALGAGRMFAASGRSRHSFGVAIAILYDAFRHHATELTSIKDTDKFRHQKIGDVVLMKCRNTVKCVSNARKHSTSTKRSRDTVLASADPKPELRAHSARINITLPCEGVMAARGVRVDRENAPAPAHAARWAFQSQRSVGSKTVSSPTDEYPGTV
jgi:hypothetical protein